MREMFKTGAGMLALAALVGLSRPALGADAVATPTFAKDVAPIFQEKCQVCHRPGSMAPMSLMTYQDARPWVRSIRAQVASKMMPPWHINKVVGIQEFQNDRSLNQTQIDTIVSWADAGAPMGDVKDLPPTKQWPTEREWQLAGLFNQTVPDLILNTDPYSMSDVGEDKWWSSLVNIPVTEERWVRAVEVRPSVKGRKNTHHVTSNLRQDEPNGLIGLAPGIDPDTQGDGQFMEWAVGKTGEIFAKDAGKVLLPGSKIQINVHYYANGEAVPNDSVEMGVYLYPKGERPKYRTILHSMSAIGPNKLDIPPNEVKMTQHFTVLKGPARLENFQPHMHMRGKAMSMEAVFPDGKREVLSYVDNYQWNWHTNYIYKPEAAPYLPKGTVVVITAWHDNTVGNKNSPDPRQWVGNGDRTVDEMAHAWVDVTYISQEDYEAEIAKRKAKPATTQNQ